MRVFTKLLLLLSVAFVLCSCGPAQILYEGPTPTVEKKIYNEKSCN